jgi:hypothetical protein
LLLLLYGLGFIRVVEILGSTHSHCQLFIFLQFYLKQKLYGFIKSLRLLLIIKLLNLITFTSLFEINIIGRKNLIKYG